MLDSAITMAAINVEMIARWMSAEDVDGDRCGCLRYLMALPSCG